MRESILQYTTPEPVIFAWARWAGVAMLFYAAAIYLEMLASNSGPASGFWNMLGNASPFAAFGVVLLYASQPDASESAAPRWLAAAFLVAVIGIAVRAMDTAMLPTGFETGIWGAAQALEHVAVPLALLLLLITQREGRLARRLPAVAIAAGIAFATLSTIIGVRSVFDQGMGNLWQIVATVTPHSSLAFVLIVAGLRANGFPAIGRVAVVLVAAVMLAAGANAVWANAYLWESSGTEWLTATNLASRSAAALLILAFAGLLTRRIAYVAAAACLIATAVSAAGSTLVFEPEGRAIFWTVSLSTVSVGFVVLLTLVRVEAHYPARDREPDGTSTLS